MLLQRELDRSLASLRLEEVRNRAAPPIAEISDPAAYRRMAEARTDKLYRLLVDAGFIADRPYYRAALAAQTGDYTPPAERNFFTHVTALDPLPLSSHQTHWIELARLRHEPHPSPIRAAAAAVQHLRGPLGGLGDGDGRNIDAGRPVRRHSARPRTGVGDARQPRRARARVAARPGQ